MRRWLKVGLAAVVVIVAVVVAGMPRSGDISRIQGTWSGNGVVLTFRGDEVILERPESGKIERLRFRLDSNASPPRIVTFDADAPSVRQPVRIFGVSLGRPSAGSPNAEQRGIYELRGDRLRVCMPPLGEDFPANFDPAAGSVFELHRE